MQYLSTQEAIERAYDLHMKAKENRDQALLKEAENLYNFALDHACADQAALYLAGTFYLESGRAGLGAVLLSASIEANDQFAPAWNNLGIAFRKMSNTKRARRCFMKAAECEDQPNSSTSCNIATTYNDDGDYENALKWYELAVEMDPENNDAKFNRAMALLSLQRWGEGWDAYNMGHLAGGVAQKTRGIKSYTKKNETDHPIWDGSEGKCVVVWGEQGVGDEVLFASCLPDLIKRSKHVVFDCHKRLFNIFKRSFPEVTCFPTREDTDTKWAWPKGLPEIDAKIGIGSLPAFFRREAADFPRHTGYLKADPDLVRHYKKPGLRIGLATAGGTPMTGLDRRSIEHQFWGPVLSLKGVEWVSLDYKPGSAERVQAANVMFGCNIVHDQEMNDDLDRQFACIAGLDLVVTVNTAVVHFSGSQNISCWTLTPKVAAWRYAADTMPWYPSVEIKRQDTLGDWAPVMDRVAQELKGRFSL